MSARRCGDGSRLARWRSSMPSSSGSPSLALTIRVERLPAHPYFEENFMRAVTYVCLALALAIPSIAHAGQVYGTIVMDGKALGGANVEISCGSDPAVKGTTAAD